MTDDTLCMLKVSVELGLQGQALLVLCGADAQERFEHYRTLSVGHMTLSLRDYHRRAYHPHLGPLALTLVEQLDDDHYAGDWVIDLPEPWRVHFQTQVKGLKVPPESIVKVLTATLHIEVL